MPISAEENISTTTTGRGSKNGCVYLLETNSAPELEPFWRVRPSHCTHARAGEAKRKSAAAAPAALEDRALSGGDGTWFRV